MKYFAIEVSPRILSTNEEIVVGSILAGDTVVPVVGVFRRGL